MDRLLLLPVYFILAMDCFFAVSYALLNRPDTDPELDLEPITRYRRPETTTQRISSGHVHDFTLPLPKHLNTDSLFDEEFDYYDEHEGMNHIEHEMTTILLRADVSTELPTMTESTVLAFKEEYPEKNQVDKIVNSSCRIFLPWWKVILITLTNTLFVLF
ncbi:uncharacterized protein LOC118201779 [Stegodyphus dumicola]|uniref:uncharacterized protein LOC118201779 n=1 Tax=Stegodyphus dumicola TaxID=202533 RepID=UPI0015A96A12|nr:uncharacterized protein LOC118201779 [Stegodyphus dumicola]